DEAVAGKVEDAVKREGQLDDAQGRPQVSAGLVRDELDFVPDLLRELLQLLQRQGFEISGGVYGVEDSRHGAVPSVRSFRFPSFRFRSCRFRSLAVTAVPASSCNAGPLTL